MAGAPGLVIEKSRVRVPAAAERRYNFVSVQGQLSVLTLYFGMRSTTDGVAAVARKRSRSFCQNCWWQVTAKHACALRISVVSKMTL